jgi:hypothetical protein
MVIRIYSHFHVFLAVECFWRWGDGEGSIGYHSLEINRISWLEVEIVKDDKNCFIFDANVLLSRDFFISYRVSNWSHSSSLLNVGLLTYTQDFLTLLFQFAGKLVPFIELMVAHASILTILAISFERYYAICEPLKAGYVCTKTRAMVICVVCWFIAGLFTRSDCLKR